MGGWAKENLRAWPKGNEAERRESAERWWWTKERGLVTVCDKSVLLHEDFVLFSLLGLRPPPSTDHHI